MNEASDSGFRHPPRLRAPAPDAFGRAGRPSQVHPCGLRPQKVDGGEWKVELHLLSTFYQLLSVAQPLAGAVNW
jgi:hypothetical protein